MRARGEIKYAVASDNTVVALRQLAYRDGVKDALKVLRDFIKTSGSPEALTTADHLLSRIKERCRRRYQ